MDRKTTTPVRWRAALLLAPLWSRLLEFLSFFQRFKFENFAVDARSPSGFVPRGVPTDGRWPPVFLCDPLDSARNLLARRIDEAALCVIRRNLQTVSDRLPPPVRLHRAPPRQEGGMAPAAALPLEPPPPVRPNRDPPKQEGGIAPAAATISETRPLTEDSRAGHLSAIRKAFNIMRNEADSPLPNN